MAPLGSGGMGEVYRARDDRLDRDVALKVVRNENSADQVQRFEREARAVGALNHPNIVAVYDVGEADGCPYVVSELLEGETLRDRLGTPVPFRKAAAYGMQIARGLAAAHEKGIYHRDIKPENVFLTRDGGVKILDFGLAKRQVPWADGDSDNPTDTLTAAGAVLGTIGYMSPEQVLGRPVDHRSDLFSLGTVLYEMLGGRRPFQGSSPVETMHAILHDEPPDLMELDPRLPPSLGRLVRHCLEKDPDDRFQSARDLAFDLQETQSLSTSTPVLRGPRVGGAARWGHLLGPAGFLGLAVLAVLALSLWPFRRAAGVPGYEQVTFRRGIVHGARFGSDGSTIVYGAAWDGAASEVRFTLPGRPESLALARPDTLVLAVSSAGELALLTQPRYWGGERSLRGTLARVSITGRAPRSVLDDVYEADWAPDGQSLAVIAYDRTRGLTRLEYPLGQVLLEGNQALHGMRISPSGNEVALLMDSGSIGRGGAVAVVDRSRTLRRLTDPWPNARGLAWSPSGREIWFTAAGELGHRALRAVSLSGRQRLLASAPGTLTLRDVSRAGLVLLTQDTERRGVIALAPGATAERELSWLGHSGMGDLSADGRTVLFADRYRVYTRATDGSDAVQIGEGNADELSPDGRWALVTKVAADGLALLPTGAGEPRPVEKHGIATYAGAHWLAGASRILFNGRAPDHGVRMYVQGLDGTPPRAIGPEGTRAATVSADGRQVAAVAGDDTIWVYPVEGGPPRTLAACEAGERPAAWSQDGAALWVYRRDQLPARIVRVDVASGHREVVHTLMPADPAGLVITKVDVTPDGRSYAYSYRRILSDLFLADGLR